MDKKDIYEHLAKIYLDASYKKKKKNKKYLLASPRFSFLAIVFLAGITPLLINNLLLRQKNLKSETALILQNDASKINFNFNPAKKEIYSLSLNNLNIGYFKALAFSLKKVAQRDNISLRVEFANNFKEKSEFYLRNVPAKWQDYSIDLSNFRKISDWTEMSTLSFIVEQWNVKENKGIVYIDNIRLLR